MRRQKTLMFGAAVGLAACTDRNGGHEGCDCAPPGAPSNDLPAIAVWPESVDLGWVSADAAGSFGILPTETIEVHNHGSGDLHIQEVAFEDGGTGFGGGLISSVLIHPGDASEVRVDLSPVAPGDAFDSLRIGSDDPLRPLVEIPLWASVSAPLASVADDAMDLGEVPIGCTALHGVEIQNLGNAGLRLLDWGVAGQDDTPWAVDSLGSDTVSPADSTTLVVGFSPLSEGAAEATLRLDSSDPWTPTLERALAGTGVAGDSITDDWVQGEVGPVDILVVLDNSMPTYFYGDTVWPGLGRLATALLEQELDVQFAVISAEDGCVIDGGWIDATTDSADVDALIETMTGDLSKHSLSERGFSLAAAALSLVDAGECNEGLVREDVPLHLLFVSDEPEQSVNSYSYYTSLFQAHKADPDQVRMHGLGGDYPTGCADADPFVGVYESTVATGGTYASICDDDWDDGFAGVFDTAELSEAFVLSDPGVEGTMAVTVDGSTLETGWTHDAAEQRLVFDPGSEPTAGQEIIATYLAAPDCSAF